VVAHEVRNPLGAIFNSLAALGRIAKPAGEVRPLLDIVREEASRVNRTVGDLLEFARPSILAKHEHALSPIVEDAVASARADARARGVSVRLEVAADASAWVDEHLLRRALLNLIDNASQASRDGDTVEVRISRQEGHALIEVEDGGPGITDEALDRIFEPFFTTKSMGTGLGLAVVKRFADSHGGDVLVRSSPDSGSVFTIRLEAS
jgi:signal transduction histidine kinase